MAVVKRKNSKNWAIILYKNGKHHWISSGTEDELEAREKELQLLRGIRERKNKERVHKFIEKVSKENIEKLGLLISRAWNTYLEEPEQKERSARTLGTKKYNLNKFIKWLAKKYPEITHIHEVDKNIANEFAKELIEEVSGKTYNNIKANLHSVFSVLKYKAELEYNVWDFIPAISNKTVSFRPFTDTEVTEILNSTKGTEWYGACLLSLYTGLRFADVANFQWNNFDFELNIISLYPAKTKRFNKKIVIPMHQTIIQYFSKLEGKGNHVFSEIAGEYKRRRSSFAEYIAKAGLGKEKNISFHSFRHTFNSRLEALNIDVGTRQKLTGHSTVDMNLIYSHAIDPLRDAISKLS